MVMLYILMLSFIIASLLYVVSFMASYKVKNKNKMTAFECGFSTVGAVHSSFSLHFFMILIIFVIFDLEVVLLLGVVLSSKTGMTNFVLIMFLVVGGIYLEWYLGKLTWVV